jgi:hypothetical protein
MSGNYYDQVPNSPNSPKFKNVEEARDFINAMSNEIHRFSIKSKAQEPEPEPNASDAPIFSPYSTVEEFENDGAYADDEIE